MSSTEEAQQQVILEARAKLRAQMGTAQRHKGSVRTARRTAAPVAGARGESDKVKSALKKLNLQSIGAVDEVILHQAKDNKALIFKNPKVTLSPHNNTTVVTGTFTEGDAPLDDLFSKLREFAGPAAGLAGSAKDEDDVPTLVEDFEAVADKSEAAKIEEVD
eukprot:Gregarina_sp_Poly_1__2177@NODE_157_length_12362_cov_62_904514_g139_i0_p6_GENE_NODE_157_length_12362_cov_62_904514_g139_i0NODE_157_length_12362_cov_62_904514_g139_i0_p6_ORF_typecomplete_len162_score36_63NAC/PF01849_18/8_1e14_NODE_157_length_12362_cov_62_904514_g139_i075578042